MSADEGLDLAIAGLNLVTLITMVINLLFDRRIWKATLAKFDYQHQRISSIEQRVRLMEVNCALKRMRDPAEDSADIGKPDANAGGVK